MKSPRYALSCGRWIVRDGAIQVRIDAPPASVLSAKEVDRLAERIVELLNREQDWTPPQQHVE